jgi:hypothetical protein
MENWPARVENAVYEGFASTMVSAFSTVKLTDVLTPFWPVSVALSADGARRTVKAGEVRRAAGGYIARTLRCCCH